MLREILTNRTLVLDGGLATELERLGLSLTHDPLWSARILHQEPEAIVKAHKRYLESGADIITTGSYQASINGFQNHLGVSEEKSKQLIKLSVELAKKARNEFYENFSHSKRKILIAGSVGPYGAHLADGSEYTGQYCDNITHEELIAWHRPRIECLLDAGVDILACETMPAAKEAEALMILLQDYTNVEAWLSFSSQSTHKTCYGDNIADAVLRAVKVAPPRQLVAIGVNCCPPEYVESLLDNIKKVVPDLPLIVYPNSGEMWNCKTGWSGEKTIKNENYLKNCINKGAKIIGGCCRSTPEDISYIHNYVTNMTASQSDISKKN